MQEYGALLGLYEDQQANLLRRDADAVLGIAGALEQQATRAQSCRDRREQAVRAFAIENAIAPETTLRVLVPHFPSEVQPLIQALIDEINHLIHRVRRDARQNQMLLSRAVEVHQDALRTLRPESFNKTYSPRGEVAMAGQSAWQAAG